MNLGELTRRGGEVTPPPPPLKPTLCWISGFKYREYLRAAIAACFEGERVLAASVRQVHFALFKMGSWETIHCFPHGSC